MLGLQRICENLYSQEGSLIHSIYPHIYKCKNLSNTRGDKLGIEPKLKLQKPVDSTLTQKNVNNQISQPLTKKLTSPLIVFILINSILGSSLFYLPSLAIATAGSASIIAWAALFIVALLVVLYMGELIVLHPTSGGTYEFCKRAYGRFGSFIAGWLIWIAGNIGMALAIIAAAQYFIPEQTKAAFYLQMGFVALWIIVLNFMAYRGIDAGATMLFAFGIITTITVTLMILPSFIDFPALFSGTFRSSFNTQYLNPFFREEGFNLLKSLGVSFLFITEAFFGFEVISYMANEVQNPRKIPKLLLIGMGISGIITVIYFLSSLGTIPYETYVTTLRPFAEQAFNTMGNVGQNVVVFGMYLVIIGTAAAWPITSSRLIQAMSKDRLFIEYFSKLHPKHNSPYRAVIFQTIIIFLFSWILFRGYGVGWNDPYKTVYLVYVVLSLFVLSLILLTVPILRKKEANIPRLFKAPFAKAGPIIFIILLIVLVVNWISVEGSFAYGILRLAGSLIIIGIPIYFLVEMFYNKRALLSVDKFLSHFAILGETISFPFSMRKKILKDFGDLSNKTILEYGCSVGTLTKKIASKVGKGKIYSTDMAFHKVKICSKRTQKFKNVTVHHHPHMHDFLLKLPQKVDGVISVGVLSYMQKPVKLLTSLSKNVKKNGEIVFIDHNKFLNLFSNINWFKDDNHLRQIFRKAGFDVQIEHKQGFISKYVIVTGKKV
jgi:basic amino acid/polyamine antiporter, APA family